MRVLITGGAGCLGSNLTERYLDAGYDVLVIDNHATSDSAVFAGGHSRLEVVEGSVADAGLVSTCFERFMPTHVLHAAAAYKDPDDWREDVATNVTGTVNVVDAARAVGVARFVYFQTVLCYGRPDSVPIRTSAPLRPATSYGISKVAGEQYVMLSGLRWVSLRIANVVAPRLSIGPIPTFYKRLKTGQSCFCSRTVRDFLDIEDFMSAMDILVDEKGPEGVFHLSTGTGHTIREVFETVARYLDAMPAEPVREVPPGADDVAEVVLDATDTERRLGWKARVGFEESLQRMLRWYDEHGVNNVYSHLGRPKA